MSEKLSDFPQAMRLFRDFPEEQLNRYEIVHLSAKDTLIQAGSFDDNLYLILRGICQPDTIPERLWFLKYHVRPMEFIGLSEILSPDPVRRMTNIVAKTPVIALKIPGSDFLNWSTKYLKTYNQIIHSVLNKKFENQSQFINLVFLNSYEAVISCLCYLYDCYRSACYRDDYAGKVKIWDTRQEIGLYVGRDTRSVDRAFNRLSKDGLISISKGKVYIDKAQAEKLYAML